MFRRLLLTVVLGLTACPQTTAPDGGRADTNTLTLTGRMCTTAPDFGSFSTRVFVLVDQRALMCRIDPPGSTTDLTLCGPLTGFTPARSQVLTRYFQQLAPRNVSVALLPFGGNNSTAWPAGRGGQGTAQPDSSLTTAVAQLHLSLGDELSDLQAALDAVRNEIESDAVRLRFAAPEELSRTRYVVIVVSGGPPSPRCNSNDARPQYADDLSPSGEWADTHPVCNDDTAQGRLQFFQAGQSRNQDAQLLATVFAMREQLGRLRLGDLRVHTIQLTDVDALVACGAPCARLLGRKLRNGVEVPVAEVPAYARSEARAVLERIAEAGGGTYAEQLPSAFSLDHIDTMTLFAPNELRTFFVQPRHAVLTPTGWVLDSDSDGVSDEKELAAGTSPTKADTDGDGFSDGFEFARTEQQFDPLQVDARGCAAAPHFCDAPDADGDELSLIEESFIGSDALHTDTDGDGLPDGLEVRSGLDPLTNDEGRDRDGDGVRDLDEVMRGSNPLLADAEVAPLTPRVQVAPDGVIGNGARCFSYEVARLPMSATSEQRAPGSFTPAGANQFRLWFSWAPNSISFSQGEWASACAWARLDGVKRVPESMSLDLERAAFGPTSVDSRTCAGAEALQR